MKFRDQSASLLGMAVKAILWMSVRQDAVQIQVLDGVQLEMEVKLDVVQVQGATALGVGP